MTFHWILLGGLLAGEPAPAQCAVEIAAVVEVRGHWKDAVAGRRLSVNDLVCADSIVERVAGPTAGATDAILLESRTRRHRLLFECRALIGCEKPLDLATLVRDETRALRGQGLFESFAEWVRARSRNASTVSRGASALITTRDSASLLMSTVIQAGTALAITDIVRAEAPAGDYGLELCDGEWTFGADRVLRRGDGCRLPIESIQLQWRPGLTGTLALPVLPEGLSSITLVAPDGRTTDRAVVLALSAEVFATHPVEVAEARDKIRLASLATTSASEELDEYIRFTASQLVARVRR